MREWLGRWECLTVSLAIWLGLTAMAASEGGLGLSWDAINHHVYLGWTSLGHRLDQDFLAANYQSLQFPYSYVPVYWLAIHGVGPVMAAALLSGLHALAAPALWLIARALLPGAGLAPMGMRALSVFLGYLSPVVLSLTDNTANDLLVATPLVWALALGVLAHDPQRTAHERLRWVLGSGLMAGVATALKFSNGPLAVLLPLLWIAGPGTPMARAGHLAWGCVACVAGFVATYGYWGWQLWVRYGNPMYPFYDGWFEPLRRLAGWGA